MTIQTEEETKPTEVVCIENPIGWVEIPTLDIARAQTFYGKTLGFKFQEQDFMGSKMAMFPMTAEGKGASGALMQGSGYIPSHEGPLVYFSVPDIEAASKKLAQNGGKVFKSKMAIGEFGFIAICEDSEGNRVALHSRT
jgi:predicted enzyme related to lactoylglutathione lyase